MLALLLRLLLALEREVVPEDFLFTLLFLDFFSLLRSRFFFFAFFFLLRSLDEDDDDDEDELADLLLLLDDRSLPRDLSEDDFGFSRLESRWNRFLPHTLCTWPFFPQPLGPSHTSLDLSSVHCDLR